MQPVAVTTITEKPHAEKSIPLGHSLDLFSIRQTNAFPVQSYAQKFFASQALKCDNYAPFFAVQNSKHVWNIWQGCCNSWTCSRCGVMRAKQEYGRMVEGCRTLAREHDLYFITITCRGKELALSDAHENYYKWTNTLLTAMRTRAKRANEAWHYCQVTENQKRGFPHSHIITTYKPHDLRLGEVKKFRTLANGSIEAYQKEALRSDWLQKRVISAGLGEQYDISKVDEVEGASRYVAKYLFKETMFDTEFPKNWRRIRYSNSFPKRSKDKAKDVMCLLTDKDIQDFANKKPAMVVISDIEGWNFVQSRLSKSDILVKIVEKE